LFAFAGNRRVIAAELPGINTENAFVKKKNLFYLLKIPCAFLIRVDHSDLINFANKSCQNNGVKKCRTAPNAVAS
jgi:hypothetical protein